MHGEKHKALKYIKSKLKEQKGVVGKSVIIVGDLIYLFQ